MGTVAIEDETDDGTAGEVHEGFERRDPGDGRGGVVGELVGLVVFLEDADACEGSGKMSMGVDLVVGDGQLTVDPAE